MPSSAHNSLDAIPLFACVCVGDKYPPHYVRRLKAGIARHYPGPHEFVCLTDELRNYGPGVTPFVIRGHGLSGWWAKLALFLPEWRKGALVVYLDLDSVIVGDLTPLVQVDSDFAICASFTRAINPAWPCAYGSCCMVLGPDLNGHIWQAFQADRDGLIGRAGKFGDQKAIEELVPDSDLLQPMLPKGFFLGYRDLNGTRPSDTSVVVFAGSHKPSNCPFTWVTDAWRNEHVEGI